MRRAFSRRVTACLAGLLLLAGGCRSVPGLGYVRNALFSWGGGGPQFTEEDLREDLAGYAARFKATVTATADEIGDASADPEQKRRALLWKIRIVPIADEAAFLSDPERAYVALFALATSQHDYLATGAGADVFGDAQPAAVAASESLVVSARDIGRRFLNDPQQEKLETQVAALAQQHPIRGVFVPETVQAVVTATAPGGSFDWVISLPLAPFRALEGVDAGAQAIREFNATAQSFNQIVADLPQRLRWNVELFSYELEQRSMVESARDSLEKVARSSERFSQAVATLPADLREQTSMLFQQLDARQGELQRTLAEARGLASDVNGAGEHLAPLAETLERTAAQVQQAGEAWAVVIAQAREPGSPPAPGQAPARPFDVLDYERTAAQIAAASAEIRGLLTDVRALGGPGEPVPALTRVEGSGRTLVNLAAWRSAELLIGFFALLFLYRRLETHLAARRARKAASA